MKDNLVGIEIGGFKIIEQLGNSTGELCSGSKVKYTGATDEQVGWGSNDDPRGLLVEGGVYTVEREEVHTWHTKLHLVEFPGKKFNSVSFAEVEK